MAYVAKVAHAVKSDGLYQRLWDIDERKAGRWSEDGRPVDDHLKARLAQFRSGVPVEAELDTVMLLMEKRDCPRLVGATRRVRVHPDDRLEFIPNDEPDRYAILRQMGEMNDKTPRDWYNAHIGQRPCMTHDWRQMYWPDYFDDGPPEFEEPWEVVPPGLDHVIPEHLRLDGRKRAGNCHPL